MKPLTSKNPLVSVIIPNYNHAKYLDERIQSVLNQTYQNFEVIILDDVSTDNSKEVIEKYRSNPHVSNIVYNELNSGSTFKQWLKGMELAKGGLIWIAESDDSCETNMLEKLVAEFSKDSNLVLAFCNSMIIDENGSEKGIIQQKKWRKNIHEDGKSFIHDYFFIDNIIYNASSALFKKDIALNLNKRYTEFRGSGDWFFWIEICEKGNVSMLKTPKNKFRKHFGNVTTKLRCNGIQQIENKKIFDYLISKHEINRFGAWIHKINNLCAYRYYIDFINRDIRDKAISAWKPTPIDFMVVTCKGLVSKIKHKFLKS